MPGEKISGHIHNFLFASCSQHTPANQESTSNTDSLTARLHKMMEKYAPGSVKLWAAFKHITLNFGSQE